MSGRRLDASFIRGLSHSLTLPSASPRRLTHLTLTRNQLYRDPKCIRLLMKFLPTQSLRHLDLSWNGLNEELIVPLGRNCLKQLSLLQSLRLSGNPIGPQGLQVLLQEGQLGRIPLVDLWECDIADDGAALLGQAMAQGTTKFQRLVLHMNGIGNVGIQALALGIMSCPSLTDLDLYCNNIDHEGIQVLAPALPYSNIERLNLRANQIGPCGAKSLAMVLKDTPALRKLLLCHNGIGDEGAGYLASALAGKHARDPNIPWLEELSLSFNELSIASVKAFASMLVTNASLKRLNLTGNLVDRRAALFLVSVLQHSNHTILELDVLDWNYENHLVINKLGFYLGANVCGRRCWGNHDVPLSAWPKKMAKMNPDFMFWFLKDRPDILTQGRCSWPT